MQLYLSTVICLKPVSYLKIYTRILLHYGLPLIISIQVSRAQDKLPTPSSGTVKRFENFASKYVAARNVDVWLPANYQADRKYAVLYMHDGQMLYDSTTSWNHQEWGVDETIEQLRKNKTTKSCIVVGIWNVGQGRHADYFPQKPFQALSPDQKQFVIEQLQKMGRTDKVFQPVSDNYLRFIVEELKPFIDRTFSTHKNAENTFIAGSSMGGLISMYAFCEYPHVFGRAACLSTHWPGIFSLDNNPIPEAFINYLNTHLPPPQSGHKLYFDYGTATLDALYEPTQLRVDTILRSKKYQAKHWKTLKFEGAEHSEKAWSKRLAIPFAFLLQN